MSQKFTGTVIDLKKEQKLAIVEWNLVRLHPKYHKPERIKKQRKAHYEEKNFPLQLGDKVKIKSDRPRSKTKKFLVIGKENG